MRMGTLVTAGALGVMLMAPLAHANETVSVPSLSSGDRVTKFNNTISVNPLGLAFGAFNANWEHKMTPGGSLDVALSFLSDSSGYVKTTGLGAGAGYKMYFSPDAFDGWYWEPRVDVASITEKVDFFGSTGSGSYVSFAPAVLIGREWVWSGGFLIDLGLGIQYYVNSFSLDVAGISYSAGFSGVFPTAKFALGYAF